MNAKTPELKRPSTYVCIALAGFMGAGKTVVGKALAEHLRWRFLDLDEEIEHRYHETIRGLFRLHGEPRFRQIESAVLEEVVAGQTELVLALGGGVYVQPCNAQLLRQRGVHVVYLEAPVEDLISRCCTASDGNPRPLAADRSAFLRLHEERLPFYRRADLTIFTAGKSIDDLVQEIASRLPDSIAVRQINWLK